MRKFFYSIFIIAILAFPLAAFCEAKPTDTDKKSCQGEQCQCPHGKDGKDCKNKCAECKDKKNCTCGQKKQDKKGDGKDNKGAKKDGKKDGKGDQKKDRKEGKGKKGQ